MPSAAVPNVPAWKRLGLKLKSAQSTPEITTEPAILDSTKRKRSEDTQDNTPSKKSKKLSALNAPPNPITPRLLERKKAVSFTPETKHEDGDSIKQLFNSWVSEQKSQDPSFDFKSSGPAFQVPTPPKVEEVVDTNLDEKERKVKRVKQPKKEKTPKKPGKPAKIIKPVVAPVRPFLQYLRQYTESKDTWKFNKNHQNHFIRSIFSLEAIPSDHAHFIYPYIHGLQGLVRTRLRDTAFAVKVQDEEEEFPAMSNQEQRKQEFEAAKSNYIATMKASRLPTEMGYEEGVLHNLSDHLMRERVAKRIRAEQILHELGSAPAPEARVVEDEGPTRVRADGKVARKRKQRTAVEEDESSSSDDSSDSSESDSNDSSDESGAENTKVARGSRDNGDSSSSSDSSDSDTEMGDNNNDEESSESSDSSDSSDSDNE